MNKEKKWIMTIDHINTKQLTEKQWNKKNPWEIEVTTIKKKTRKKKITAESWRQLEYKVKENWKLDTWRPTVIDDNVIQKLAYAFRCDCTINEACAYAGIHPNTYYEKIKQDKKFMELMDKSKELFLVDVKTRARELMQTAESESVSWTLLKNALEKRDPNYKQKIETENTTTVNVSFVWIAMRAKEQRMEQLDIDKQQKKLAEQNWERQELPIKENEN